jgi:hypothetical protein
MIKLLKRVVNAIGLDIIKHNSEITNPTLLHEKYQTLIKETIFLFEKHDGYQLPNNPKRVKLLSKLLGTNISEGLSIISCLNKALSKPGDVCEFGVAQGTTSALMANEINGLKDKNLWLFDSFEGLPMPTEKDQLKDDIFSLGSMEAYIGTMACGLDQVSARLQEISFPKTNTKVIPGFIEQTIHLKNLPEKVCFAYVDFDFYEPILIALNFLHTRMEPGSFVVVDDYDWFSTGAKTAVDEFFDQHKNAYKLTVPDKTLGHFAVLEKIA